MRIIYNNLLDALSSSSMLASSYETSYPLTNAIDQRLTVKWQTEATTSATAVFDLGATTSTTVFAVLGHDLASGGTVTITGNNDIASGLTWTTSGESTTLTITYNIGAMIYFPAAAMSYRYWKFSFSGQSESGFSIGRLWIGNYLTVNPSSLDDFTVTKVRDDIVIYGKGRQKYSSVGNGWRKFELSFPKTSGTMLSSIQALYDTVGKHTSFIFCNFDTSRSYDLVDPCYVSIQEDIGFSHRGRQQYTYGLILEEDR